MQQAPSTVIILSSPTASGKTEVALEAGKHLPIEIISADSRQVYKYLSVGTAKPARDELLRVPHHCIDMLDPDERWNAGRFAHHARTVIPEIIGRRNIQFITGGTGLYIQTLDDGIAVLPGPDLKLREKLTGRYEKEGLGPLVAELEKADPFYASEIDRANPRRVLRALEIYYMTGMTRSEIAGQTDHPLPHPFLWYGLAWERKKLYSRIEARVDRMIEEGLVDEVIRIKKAGYDRSVNALQTVGYAEVFEYLEGNISRDEMIRLIKQNTRRFAKRQMTWFRRERRIQWIEVKDDAGLKTAADEIVKRISRVLSRTM